MWKVCSLSGMGEAHEDVVQGMFDVCCCSQEMRWKGFQDVEMRMRFKLWWSGNKYGVDGV